MKKIVTMVGVVALLAGQELRASVSYRHLWFFFQAMLAPAAFNGAGRITHGHRLFWNGGDHCGPNPDDTIGTDAGTN